MSSPTNTTKAPRRMTDALPSEIEASERRGGEEMLVASVVPTDGAELLEDLGFVLGEIVADDPIFREVRTPEGWRREMGDSPYGYWTYVVDPQGRRRVAMYYKAAFYDRIAKTHVLDLE